MADETLSPTPQTKTAKVVDTTVPRGNIAQNYGPLVGGGGVLIALFSFLTTKPQGALDLLGQFGPKWIYFAVLTLIVWDLMKRALKLAGRGVSHLGEMAGNVGRVGDAVQAFATKNDRTAEEQQRLTAFAVQNSQRSVELAQETNALVKQLVAKQVPGA